MKKGNRDAIWKTIRMFGSLTLVILVIGYLFGRILQGVLLPTPAAGGNQNPADTVHMESPEDQEEDETAAIASHELLTPAGPEEAAADPEGTIFILRVGMFSSFDNAAAMGGSLQALDFPWDVSRDDDGMFRVSSFMAGTRQHLAEAETILQAEGIDYFVASMEIDRTDPAWDYFLQSVNGIPFEMSSDFIQRFQRDDMHIFGFLVSLSDVEFEPLSLERQRMLLGIYNWLKN